LTAFGNIIVCLWKRSRDVLYNNLLNIFEINKDMLFRGSITVKRVLTATKVLIRPILIELLLCLSAVRWIIVKALTRHVVCGLILVANAKPFLCVALIGVYSEKTFSHMAEYIICSDGVFVWLILLSAIKMCLRVMRYL
jgi:hypothetical protein